MFHHRQTDAEDVERQDSEIAVFASASMPMSLCHFIHFLPTFVFLLCDVQSFHCYNLDNILNARSAGMTLIIRLTLNTKEAY